MQYSQVLSDELGGGPFSRTAAAGALGPADRIRRASGAGHCVICRPLGSGLAKTRRLPLRHAERHSLPARRACPPRCARSACARRAAHSVPRAKKSAEDLDFLGFRDRLLDPLRGPSGGEDPITGNGFTL